MSTTDRNEQTADGPQTADGQLQAERTHLKRGQRALRAMREQVQGTAVAAGDPVADKVTNAHLRADKARRLATFDNHDEAGPLFFGRLDYAAETAGATETAEAPETAGAAGHRIYLGRRHVREEAGDDPLVVDWRAGVARPFYRAHRTDPMGVSRRRRFGFAGGELTAFEDEILIDASRGELLGPGAPEAGAPGGSPTAGGAGGSAGEGGSLLEREIERPRSGPMRDIVATIQPEQDEIVRADLDVSICVQGAPGTGKTAVGLHRAAYLLYTYRERLRRSGVLVVGPNRAFLGYIASVLPALGEFTVEQRSVGDLLAATVVRGADPIDLATLKGDARLATVIHRALHAGITVPVEPVRVVVREGRFTVGAEEVAGMIGAVRSGAFSYGAGRAILARRIAAAAARQAELAGHHVTDSGIEALARSRAVRAALEEIWPKADAATLIYRLFTDPLLLASASDGLLTAAEQELLLNSPPPGRDTGMANAGRVPRTVRWSIADAYLIDEAQHLIDRVPGFGHVIVDEAQDLSAMQCRAIGRRCADGSLTVLGDLAQGTTAWAASSWSTALTHLGRPSAHIEVLERSHRVPAEILHFANHLLPHIAAGVTAATSLRSVPGALTVVPAEPGRLLAEAIGWARRSAQKEGSTAVVVPDQRMATTAAALRDAGLSFTALGDDSAPDRFSLVPASLAKGLEFDHVVLVDPAAVIDGESGRANGLRRLYVALTRAVTSLVLVAEVLPAELPATEG